MRRFIRKVMPLDSGERRGVRHAPCEQSAFSLQVLLFFRVAVLCFYAVCAHERLPVTREIKESAVCYQGLCVVRSELRPYKTFSLYVASVAVGTVFAWIVHCTEYDVTAWQYDWPTKTAP